MRPLVPVERFEVFAEGLDHPEGLAFDSDGTLWAGGELGQIYKINAKGKPQVVTTLGGFNLGLTFSTRQDLFVCNLKLGALIHMDRTGKVLRSWERVGRYRLRTPNFSVFDSQGNLYFTDSGEWRKNDGYLFVLRPNGRIEQLLSGLAFPNGLALSADERTLFVVQSTNNDVITVPIVQSASVGKPRIFAKNLDHIPDGLALDAEQNLYVTCYGSHNVYRVSPKGKVSLFAHDLSGTILASPTNAAFGSDGYIYFANLSRWHICRVHVGAKGQPLENQRAGSPKP